MGSIIELVRSLPEIVGVFLELRKLWNDYVAQENRQMQMAALKNAIKDARVNRDTTALTDLVNRIVTDQPLPPSK